MNYYDDPEDEDIDDEDEDYVEEEVEEDDDTIRELEIDERGRLRDIPCDDYYDGDLD
jgi:hypothetical protein